ncbi:hypothetical protein [Sphingomonas sp. PWP1-2]|uniref:hypothetical protein n=1 Tax=Sphingomonas sp. PWP1-2 TaxID=2804558 RepID=UPI003CEB5128
MSRAEYLKTATPQIIAEVRMYDTANGGRTGPAFPGWGCPCMVSRMEPLVGYDALPLLGDQPLLPGETRRLGFVFLSPENAVPVMRAEKHFYLWEGGFIGEAVVID